MAVLGRFVVEDPAARAAEAVQGAGAGARNLSLGAIGFDGLPDVLVEAKVPNAADQRENQEWREEQGAPEYPCERAF
ncbi:hypothetical protein KTAU_26260 [Thermogemmatispora aurantia]|uniref:Uncharacterized protein n=1 Tax=Thermogemmatispora aurantia TaxID=2045279 RepID=A0A5J4KB60_9CHLR|nr:hypothetical protein [Thermogemmatispora sp.]GER83989.1 hypothetical protein KTAU_26260 [Thermogemmatispora aurantia]